MCWYFKTRLESGPVTAHLTTTVVHSSNLLINDVINLITRSFIFLRLIGLLTFLFTFVYVFIRYFGYWTRSIFNFHLYNMCLFISMHMH